MRRAAAALWRGRKTLAAFLALWLSALLLLQAMPWQGGRIEMTVVSEAAGDTAWHYDIGAGMTQETTIFQKMRRGENRLSFALPLGSYRDFAFGWSGTESPFRITALRLVPTGSANTDAFGLNGLVKGVGVADFGHDGEAIVATAAPASNSLLFLHPPRSIELRRPWLAESALSALIAATGILAWRRRNSFALFVTAAASILALFVLNYALNGFVFLFSDIGSDTFVQFYPLQVATLRSLSQLHSLSWSFDLGLGGYIGAMLDPFIVLGAPFGLDHQALLRLPIYAIKLLLAGGFFYGYLRCVGAQRMAASFGALGYAFSSYAVVNAQWDGHSVELVQFSAYLFFFERFMLSRRWRYAVAAGATVALGGAFGVYASSLFAVLYAVVRWLATAREAKRDAALAIMHFVAGSSLGFLLLAPLQFPHLYYFLESPRVSGEHSVLRQVLSSLGQINDRGTLSSEIAGFLGKDVLGTGNRYSGWGNYLEGPGFYVGLLLLLTIPQLLAPGATRRQRWGCIAALAGIALYLVFPALRYAVYGFGHIAFRLSTLWIAALVAVLGVLGLQRALIHGAWRPGLLLGAAGVCAIAGGALLKLPGTVNAPQAWLAIGFAAGYTVVWWPRSLPWRQSLPALLLCLFCAELTLFAIPGLLRRDHLDEHAVASYGASYDDGTATALGRIRAEETPTAFYRIEKDYDSVFFCDSLAQDYAGTKSYYFHASGVTRFVDKLALPRFVDASNYIGSMASRRPLLDLLGVKYLLDRRGGFAGDASLEKIATVDGTQIYRNPRARALAQWFDAVTGEAEADSLPIAQRDVLLLSRVLVDNPEAVRARLAAMPPQPGLSASVAVRKLRDDRLDVDLGTPVARVLLLAMPFDRGWQGKIDGVDLPLIRADYGLTAAIVPAGTHALQLRYVPPGRVAGWWAALAAALLLIWRARWARFRSVRSAARAPSVEPDPAARRTAVDE